MGKGTALPRRVAGNQPQVRLARTGHGKGPGTPRVLNTLAVNYHGANGFPSPRWGNRY